MKLHRAGSRPDWALVTPAKRSFWQRLAVATRGVVTPGNITSLIGLLLVFAGLVFVGRRAYGLGLIVVGLGRLCDVADGMIAEYTKTKSPLGELIDAVFDKIATLSILIVLVATSVLPWQVAVVLAIPNAANAVISWLAERRHKRLHPSLAGKLAMACLWAALLMFVLVAAVGNGPSGIYIDLAYVAAVMATVLGVYSAIGYGRSLAAAS